MAQVSLFDRQRLDEILEIVAQSFRMSAKELRRRTNERQVTHPRMVAWWMARNTRIGRDGKGWSYPRIGRAMSMDHSTVVHGIQEVERMRSAQPDFRAFTDDLKKRVESFDHSEMRQPPARRSRLTMLEQRIAELQATNAELAGRLARLEGV